MRRRPAAILAAVTLAISTGAAQAPAPALTPGQVLLLANNPGPASAEALKHALASDDPHVRLVAGRVMGVEPEAPSVDALVDALAREQDRDTGAELVRDLLLVGGATAVSVADPQAHRLGEEALLAFSEWQARVQPTQLIERVARLGSATEADRRDWLSVVVLAAKQHPELQNELLRRWMPVAPERTWGAALDVLHLPGAAPGGDGIIVEALRSDRPHVRLETVWFVLDEIARQPPSARAVLESAGLPAPPDSSPWETFGRELVARFREHAKTPDRTDLIEQDGGHNIGFLITALQLKSLTDAERKAAATIVPSLPFPFAAPVPRQASLRTIPPLAPGVLTDVLQTAKCDYRPGTVGFVDAAYRADGRPRRLRVDPTGLSEECVAALTALARTTVADTDDAVTPSSHQSLMLPMTNDYASCADAAAVNDRRPANYGPGEHVIQQPKKIRDVQPGYPASAQAARIQGVVIIVARLSTTGCVYSARVVRSIPMLDVAAVEAVTQWRFDPLLVDGRPAPFEMTTTVNFTLR